MEGRQGEREEIGVGEAELADLKRSQIYLKSSRFQRESM